MSKAKLSLTLIQNRGSAEMGKMSKSVSKNLGGIVGAVSAIALVGIVGYVILRRDEILSGLDRRLNIGGGISGGGTSGIGGTGNEGYPTGNDVDTSGLDNNDNDSSSPNTSNQDRGSTFSPRKSSQHNRLAQTYQNIWKKNGQSLDISRGGSETAGYQFSVQYAPRESAQAQYNQYVVNKQGFDRASTFQSPAGSLPKPKRDSSGKAVVKTAVPKALSHLFSSNTRVVTSKAKRPNAYAGISGGHTGFRDAGR